MLFQTCMLLFFPWNTALDINNESLASSFHTTTFYSDHIKEQNNNNKKALNNLVSSLLKLNVSLYDKIGSSFQGTVWLDSQIT